MGSLFRGKNINRTVISDVTSSITKVTNPGRAESVTVSPATAKVALDRQTSGLRVSGGGDITVRADIFRAVFSIVTSTRAPKTFGEKGSGLASDWNVKEASGGGNDRTVVANLGYERLVLSDCIFVQAIFWINGSERGGCVRRSRRG